MAGSVTVRMYKGLLGDCFLLRFEAGGSASHVLIDCGILQGIAGGVDRMKLVAADVVKRTGGRLDLLVVTHEHADHISGFSAAPDVFFGDTLKIDRLWMAWTEKPGDPQAKGLHDRFDKAKMALAAAAAVAARLTASGANVPPDTAASLAAFNLSLDGDGGSLTHPRTGAQILAALKNAAGDGKVDYLEPGQVTATPGPLAIRTYVLGPPRTEARLFKDLPTAKAPETYLDGDGLDAADHILSATQANNAAFNVGDAVADTPFARRYSIAQADVVRAPKAKGAPDTAEQWLNQVYYGGPDWRNIDADWLGATDGLGLKLDSDTNNTSLVLAFELPSGKVLLFCGDAQVGNWLSWHDQAYPSAAGQPPVPGAIQAADILKRVVLYKVGHHSSHNATLDAQGLELMTDPGLVAMIPLVEEYAHAQGSGWAMPYPPLLTRLLAKTSNRVLRGDCKAGWDLKAPINTDPAFLAAATDGPDDLYVDYVLPTDQVGDLASVKTL